MYSVMYPGKFKAKNPREVKFVYLVNVTPLEQLRPLIQQLYLLYLTVD